MEFEIHHGLCTMYNRAYVRIFDAGVLISSMNVRLRSTVTCACKHLRTNSYHRAICFRKVPFQYVIFLHLWLIKKKNKNKMTLIESQLIILMKARKKLVDELFA